MSSSMSFTRDEISRHNSENDCWVIINGEVYNMTPFLALHPGGKASVLRYAGKDASEAFALLHTSAVLPKYQAKLRVGTVAGEKSSSEGGASGPVVTLDIAQAMLRQLMMEDSNETAVSPTPQLETFGDMIPYGDPIWYQRFNSPYYKPTHVRWREEVRRFVETQLLPIVEDLKTMAEPPKELLLAMGQAGYIGVMSGVPFPSEFLPAEVKPPEDYDHFHRLILFDEIARIGYSNIIAGLTNGQVVAIAPFLRFAKPEVKAKFATDLLLGRKLAALAISEPAAGSDVAGITTTAVRDGDCYVINGTKKWITNGMYADLFVTAVCTGRRGKEGISFILVEKGTPGFTAKKLRIRASDISGTALLDFVNVRVPVSHLLGAENDGFKLIMHNFNGERLWLVSIAVRLARVCLEESIRFAMRRKTFGKLLHEHQAVRMKVAAMAREVEMLQAWLESIVYQMNTMTPTEANLKVGDVLCLLKAQAGRCYQACASLTTQVFGGNALHMDGWGRKVEPSVGQVKGVQIPGGAEDVMEDFAARVAFKRAQFAKL